MIMFCTESSVVMFYYVCIYSLGSFIVLCFYVFCAAHCAYSINIYVWCGAGWSIPSFSGSSYVLLRRVTYISRDVSLMMRFKPLRPDGLIIFSSQYPDGTGDFLSISLRHAYVEFR